MNGIPVDIVTTLRDAVVNIDVSADSLAITKAEASNQVVPMPPSTDQGQRVPEPDDQYERKA